MKMRVRITSAGPPYRKKLMEAFIFLAVPIYLIGIFVVLINYWDRSPTLITGVALMWPVVAAIIAVKGSVIAIYYALLGKL